MNGQGSGEDGKWGYLGGFVILLTRDSGVLDWGGANGMVKSSQILNIF